MIDGSGKDTSPRIPDVLWSHHFRYQIPLLLLYLRLFSPDRIIRYAIYFGIMANFVFYSTTTIISGALCLPRHGEAWLNSAQTARCKRALDMYCPHGIFGVVSEFYIFIIPIPIVIKLNLPLRKMVGVLAIFATGVL